MKLQTLFFSVLFAPLILCASQIREIKKSPDDYKTDPAHEAIIFDSYQEVMRFTLDLPDSYKKVLAQFGFTENDVTFYTAVRMKRFVEKVGNSIILLYPNFFLYLTEEEQATLIAVELARMRAGDNTEIAGNDSAIKDLNTIQTVSYLVAGFVLGFIYCQQLKNAAISSLPYIDAALKSPAFGIVSSYAVVNYLAQMLYDRRKIAQKMRYELEVLDAMGPDALIKLRERQVAWSKHSLSWPVYQYYKLLGKLGLIENPEAFLESYNEHLKEHSHDTATQEL